MSKIRKPSERLERRENVQEFIDYLLTLTIPEYRKDAIMNGRMIDVHQCEGQYGFVIGYDYMRMMIDCNTEWAYRVYRILQLFQQSVMEYAHEKTNAQYKDLQGIGYEVFMEGDEAHNIISRLHEMAMYLVPGEKVIASAIEQLMGRPQTEMAGGFGGVFYYAFQAIKQDADTLGDAIVREYKRQNPFPKGELDTSFPHEKAVIENGMMRIVKDEAKGGAK